MLNILIARMSRSVNPNCPVKSSTQFPKISEIIFCFFRSYAELGPRFKTPAASKPPSTGSVTPLM